MAKEKEHIGNDHGSAVPLAVPELKWSLSKRALARVERVTLYFQEFGFFRGINNVVNILSKDRIVALAFAGSPPLLVRTATSDISTFEQVFLHRQYRLLDRLEKPRLIVDAGANIGCASLYFAREYPNAHIVSIEPEDSNFEMLERNTKHLEKLTRIKAALWNKSTYLEIENPRDEKWSIRVRESHTAETQTIKAITVPEILSMTGAKQIDILKLDIESSEKELFESNYDLWLDRVGVIFVELHDWIRPGCSTSFYRATSRYSFNQFQSGETTVLFRDPPLLDPTEE